jgi:hypothetical protein
MGITFRILCTENTNFKSKICGEAYKNLIFTLLEKIELFEQHSRKRVDINFAPIYS